MGENVLTSPFLTPREVAEVLRCNRQTVYARIANGTIPAVRLDPHSPLLVPRRELERLLQHEEN